LVHAEEDPIWTQTLKYHTGFSLRLSVSYS
jgi:hypothetical protein